MKHPPAPISTDKLKIGFNKVFGYFIEISNSYLNQIPEGYIRKQTLTNGERFITEELKKHEDDVLSAKFKSTELEYKLFCDFREYSKEFVSKIREIVLQNVTYTQVLHKQQQKIISANL